MLDKTFEELIKEILSEFYITGDTDQAFVSILCAIWSTGYKDIQRNSLCNDAPF